MEKQKEILIDPGKRKDLLKHGSYPTIKKALFGEANTPQKIKIRLEAIKLGGIIKPDDEL